MKPRNENILYGSANHVMFMSTVGFVVWYQQAPNTVLTCGSPTFVGGIKMLVDHFCI